MILRLAQDERGFLSMPGTEKPYPGLLTTFYLSYVSFVGCAVRIECGSVNQIPATRCARRTLRILLNSHTNKKGRARPSGEKCGLAALTDPSGASYLPLFP